MEKTVFKKGDRVFHIEYGWGEVIKDDDNFSFPIIVKFEDMEQASFLATGKELPESLQPLLSFTEYTLQGFSQERPIELPSYGECVFYSFDDVNWRIASFETYSDGMILLRAEITNGVTKTFFCKNIKRFVNC